MQYSQILAGLFGALIAASLFAWPEGISDDVIMVLIFLAGFYFAMWAWQNRKLAKQSSPQPSLQPAPQTSTSSISEKQPIDLVLIADSLQTAIAFLSDAGQVVYKNQAFEKLFPHVKIGQNLTSISRSKDFVEPFHHDMAQNETRNIQFQTLREPVRYFAAWVRSVDFVVNRRTQVRHIVEFHDQTELIQTGIMRRDFIANVSHEIRTPLSGIMGAIETIEDYGQEDPQVWQKFLPIMKRQAERMNNLVFDVLNLSKIEMSTAQSPDQLVDMAALAARIVDEMGIKAQARNVLLVNELDQPAEVIGDAEQLEYLLINILDNAIKYSPNGGEVRIRRLKNNPAYPHRLGFVIEDQGMGIALNDIHRLSERFFRSQSDQVQAIDGTGLGLAIVKHILRRHDSALLIHSRINEGSAFSFYLKSG